MRTWRLRLAVAADVVAGRPAMEGGGTAMVAEQQQQHLKAETQRLLTTTFAELASSCWARHYCSRPSWASFPEA